MNAPSTGPPSVTVEYLKTGTGTTWQVAVLHPSPHPPAACGDDEAVESSLVSFDMPSSHVNYLLHAGATEGDARRVVDCLQQALDSGSIIVTPPSTE